MDLTNQKTIDIRREKMPIVSTSASKDTEAVLTAVEKTEKQMDVVVSALDAVATKTERQIKTVTSVLSDVASNTESQIDSVIDSLRKSDEKRKKQAKSVAKVTLGGVALSIAVFFFGNQEVGLLCAVLSTALPSFVNLVDN
jgi:hypothetical protein